MPRKSGQTPPSYCLHKASGNAVVRIQGKDHYLGKHGSRKSHQRYEQLINQWHEQRETVDRRRRLASDPRQFEISVAEVIFAYREFATEYYSIDGEPTSELSEIRYSLRALRLQYGDSLACQFGPRKLKDVRQRMIDDGLSRGVINQRINRIRRCMKWAASEELIPPEIYHGLKSVSGLRRGRSAARETDGVKPVKPAVVEETKTFVSRPVAAMIDLQLLAGMRPCEATIMRQCDIDFSDQVWIYQPHSHKNQWREQERKIPLGPKAQLIIQPFLENRLPNEYLFSPREAEERRNRIRREQRRSPMTPSHRRRQQHSIPARNMRDRYDVASYRRAIRYGVLRANRKRNEKDLPPLPHWFPLQLRHTMATQVRREFGVEAAQVSLGHRNAEVTEIYAERDLQLAIRVAKETG